MYRNEKQIILFKAPEDPEEKKEWTKHMVRLQVAMWVDEGAECSYCHKPYTSVDDWLARNPKGGDPKQNHQFVDSACWPEYEAVALRERSK